MGRPSPKLPLWGAGGREEAEEKEAHEVRTPQHTSGSGLLLRGGLPPWVWPADATSALWLPSAAGRWQLC